MILSVVAAKETGRRFRNKILSSPPSFTFGIKVYDIP
jgi:hypothetical protein